MRIGIFQGHVGELFDGSRGGAIASGEKRCSQRRLSWKLGENRRQLLAGYGSSVCEEFKFLLWSASFDSVTDDRGYAQYEWCGGIGW